MLWSSTAETRASSGGEDEVFGMVDDAVQVPDGGSRRDGVGEGGAVGDGPVAGLRLGVVQDAVVVGGDDELAAQLPDGFRGSEAGFVGLGEVEVELAFEEGVPVGTETVAGGFGGGEVVVVFEFTCGAVGFFGVLVGRAGARPPVPGVPANWGRAACRWSP